MALNQRRSWLICYDIANAKRLVRLHRFLKGNAMPVQYSVFYWEGSTTQLRTLMQNIAERIDKVEDDVRAYPLSLPTVVDALGRGNLPDDALLVSNLAPSLSTLVKGRAR
jgi:CRISPR-associated protein Cas2